MNLQRQFKAKAGMPDLHSRNTAALQNSALRFQRLTV